MSIASARLLDCTDAVLFDLDGTLLDTAPDLVNALHRVCAEEAQPKPAAATAARHVSTGAIGLIQLAFPEHDDDQRELLRQRLVSIYEDNLCVHTRVYDGMHAVLDALDAADITWGVVTNKMRYLAEPILQTLDLLQRCAVVVGGDTAARNKPHPDPIHHALAELGIEPQQSVYVGDAEKDVLAGKAAGTRTVAVTWGYIIPGHNPHHWNADYTIQRPAELLAL